jgi:ribulose-phosphate 3-epimerase
MAEVIPAVNASTWEEVREKIRKVEHFTEWIRLDVADGTFTKNTLWHQPLDLVGFETAAKLEIHLMEDYPEERFEAWLLPAVRRLIVHEETLHDFDLILNECHKENIEVGVAIATDTSWTRLKPFLSRADMLQILAVHPGLAGQEFQGHNYSKIKHLRALCPPCKIEVDGGIKVGVARHAVSMGATVLVAASSVFNAPDIGQAIRILKNDAAAGEHTSV